MMWLDRKGFTLVEIMIVVAIIGLLAAIAIPNFVKARTTARLNTCRNNQRIISSAIEQWALDENKAETDLVTGLEWKTYIKGAVVPTCPAGGAVYTYGGGTVGTYKVTCPNAGHTLP